jgi:hypothetical protein
VVYHFQSWQGNGRPAAHPAILNRVDRLKEGEGEEGGRKEEKQEKKEGRKGGGERVRDGNGSIWKIQPSISIKIYPPTPAFTCIIYIYIYIYIYI